MRPDADADAAASLLLGACLHHAVLSSFAERPTPTAQLADRARALAEVLAAGLRPTD
ncbi:hypothetical protein [Plantactinospora sp. GCM10030261]|uniref:hypothetical protein n=1 Tax=Plantactinospora sp. GCM10030261 TaxID=3273420 RepID=UPI0036231DA5